MPSLPNLDLQKSGDGVSYFEMLHKSLVRLETAQCSSTCCSVLSDCSVS